MAAGAWVVPAATKLKLLDGTLDLDAIVTKMALFTSSWTPGDTYSTTNEVAAGNGYTQGGVTLAETLNETGGTVTFDVPDGVWTASGGSITARYAVLYDDNTNAVIAYSLLDDTPADVTVTDGNTLTVAPHANGVFTLA